MQADPQDDRFAVVRVMEQCAIKLPEHFDADFWLASLLQFAELYTEVHRHLTPRQKGLLLGFGGLFIGQIAKEREATSLADQLIERARRGGGNG